MEVARQDEIEDAGLHPVDHLREAGQQDAQVGGGIGQPLGSRRAASVRARVNADDLHLPAANLHRLRLVGEQARGTELIQHDRPRERILRDRVVVVPEHRVGIRQTSDQLAQLRLAARPREQVARDQRQVRLARLHPIHRPLDGACPAGRRPQMEIGEVRDRQPVELLRKSPDLNRRDFAPNPAGLEPSPRRRRGSGADLADQRRWYQASSFSSTGVTGTT